MANLRFQNDIRELGVDEANLDALMEIHYANPDLAPYECKRLYNIRKNEEKLLSLNLINIKPSSTPSKPLKRKRWSTNNAVPSGPSRKSDRIAGIKAVQYNLSDYVAEPTTFSSPKPRRQHEKKLKFDDIVDVESDSAVEILDVLKEQHENYFFHLDPDTEIKQNSQISDDIKNLYLDENHRTKLCKTRLSCIAVHSAKKLIVAGGSKWGELGLFMPGEKKVTIRLEPHTNIVSGCQFSGRRLFTSSYDCTVRMFDAETLQFDEVYSGASSETFFRSIDVVGENEIMSVSNDGQVIKIDVRENKKVCAYPSKEDHSEYGTLWGLHHNKFDMNYFLTSSNNAKISAWDHRNTKKPVDVNTSHDKTVSSARFDPMRGKRIVTTGNDDKICILEFVDKTNIKHVSKINHFNNTGRWLTKFQAKWHPSSDELFVIGSMGRPRQVDLYNIKGHMEHTLSDENFINSVQSLTEFHPTLNFLVCGNASGYCNIFRGP